jgi:hypothetical protein
MPTLTFCYKSIKIYLTIYKAMSQAAKKTATTITHSEEQFFGREFFRENFLNGIFLIKSFLVKSSLAG